MSDDSFFFPLEVENYFEEELSEWTNEEAVRLSAKLKEEIGYLVRRFFDFEVNGELAAYFDLIGNRGVVEPGKNIVWDALTEAYFDRKVKKPGNAEFFVYRGNLRAYFASLKQQGEKIFGATSVEIEYGDGQKIYTDKGFEVFINKAGKPYVKKNEAGRPAFVSHEYLKFADGFGNFSISVKWMPKLEANRAEMLIPNIAQRKKLLGTREWYRPLLPPLAKYYAEIEIPEKINDIMNGDY